MEEIIYSLTEIRKALENDRLDILLAFITGLIFLTILNIHLSVKMNKQNEKLHFFS